jgi:ribosomal protein L3
MAGVPVTPGVIAMGMAAGMWARWMSLARSGARRVAARGPGGVRFVLAVMVAVASFAMVVTAPPASAATPGTGLAWGNNLYGQLGNGTNSTTPVNVQLPAGTTITKIAAGFSHSLAVTSTGAVLAWGDNGAGELGNGTNTNSATPVNVQLPAGTTVTAIAAGYFHSLALTSTGAVLAWGTNMAGQLGNGTTTNTNTPVPVSTPANSGITAIAAGGGHSLALTSAGAVLAWGYNQSGHLGNGTTTSSNTPVPISAPANSGITAIAAGGGHSLALTSTGAVLAWGTNTAGELGNGTTTSSNTPVAVSAPANGGITAIAAGHLESLALTSAGAVLAWGYNQSGQLGNGTNTDSNTPVAVNAPATGGITAIAAGDGHSLAVTSTGAVLAWGFNADGELGNGTTTSSNTPVPVSAPATSGITAIAGGGQHSLATGRRR